MKTVVFSDTHLTPTFDSRKFKILKEIIEQADQVVINGDFWEGLGFSFDTFVNSEWSKTLFPLLKNKKAIYLFGNHDKKKYSDERTSLFSDQQLDTFTFKSGEKTFHVTHGDEIVVLPDVRGALLTFLENLENFAFKVLGKTFLRVAYGHFNEKIKKQIKGKYGETEFLITGHTHCAELDLADNFVNDGFIKHGLAQYVLIEDGSIQLIEKKY